MKGFQDIDNIENIDETVCIHIQIFCIRGSQRFAFGYIAAELNSIADADRTIMVGVSCRIDRCFAERFKFLYAFNLSVRLKVYFINIISSASISKIVSEPSGITGKNLYTLS